MNKIFYVLIDYSNDEAIGVYPSYEMAQIALIKIFREELESYNEMPISADEYDDAISCCLHNGYIDDCGWITSAPFFETHWQLEL